MLVGITFTEVPNDIWCSLPKKEYMGSPLAVLFRIFQKECNYEGSQRENIHLLVEMYTK